MASGTEVVVVGTGHAAVQLVVSLREGGFDGRVTLVGQELQLPYERPPLSKDYLAAAAGQHVTLRPPTFYEDVGVRLILGEQVTEVDREAAMVRTGTGRELRYDHLVLATGSRPVDLPIPGIERPGVHLLRTLDDATRLRDRLSASSRAVVVGGGFIGLEFAAVAVNRGVGVTVVEAADRLMARAVSPVISAHYEAWHRQAGVEVLLAQQVGAVSGDVRARGVTLASGREVVADVVLVAAGVRPNVELAVAAGLEIDNGVVVDDQLRTADPRVSAIGDCAAFPDVRWAARTRVESIQNANDHARCLAARLLGNPGPYRAVPWFWSLQGDQRLQIVGLRRPDLRDVRVPSKRGFSVYGFDADGVLHSVESVNDPAVHMQARTVLQRGLALREADVRDPGFELAAHVRAQLGPTHPAPTMSTGR